MAVGRFSQIRTRCPTCEELKTGCLHFPKTSVFGLPKLFVRDVETFFPK